MRKVVAACVLPVLSCAASASFGDSLVNGGFETGNLTGWQTPGAASVVTSSFGVGPAQGSHQAFLSNDMDQGAAVPVEGDHGVWGDPFLSFFGIQPDYYAYLHCFFSPGSGIKTSLTVEAGDILSFDWKFLTNEFLAPPNLPDDPSGSYPDFAMLVVDGNPSLLYQVPSYGSPEQDFHLSNTALQHETDWRTTYVQFATAGTYSIGIGVMHDIDPFVTSGILLDRFQIMPAGGASPAPVPLPPAILSVPAMGLVAFSFGLMRRRLGRSETSD